jgi:murein DD-endopeptidase MepM/ murein hydrolase activator NlpD
MAVQSRKDDKSKIILFAVALLLLGKKKKGGIKGGVTPIKGAVRSKFGWRKRPVAPYDKEFHNGVDLRATVGTLVKSPWAGTVTKEYYSDLGGNQLVIVHDNGYRTGYAHLSKYLVKEGEKVAAGQYIAATGESGNVTGPHLHFTLTNPDGEKIDPEKYFSFS